MFAVSNFVEQEPVIAIALTTGKKAFISFIADPPGRNQEENIT